MRSRFHHLTISLAIGLVTFAGLLLSLSQASATPAKHITITLNSKVSPNQLQSSDSISIYLPTIQNAGLITVEPTSTPIPINTPTSTTADTPTPTMIATIAPTKTATRVPTVTKTPTQTSTPTKPPVYGPNLKRGIYGMVYENGMPISDVKLDLRLITTTETLCCITGGEFEVLTSVTTTADGRYSFLAIPFVANIGNDVHYYAVAYSNPSTTTYNGRLGGWLTNWLYSTAYTTTQEFNIGNFDIGDVILTQPISGTTITLPHTFQFTRRNTPVDGDYIIYFSDNKTFGKGFLVGAGNSFTLTAGMLPSTVKPNQGMNWSIGVSQPTPGAGYRFTASSRSFYGFNLVITNP